MPNWVNLPPLLGIYGPGVVAFVLALGGVAAWRRFEGRWAAVAAVAVMAGWMLLLPSPRAWVFPRVVAEHLVGPAAVAALGAAAMPGLARGRRAQGGLGVAGLGFGGWWLAGAGVAPI